ncbi:GNAT family N-acetyltransferase [Chitinophaga defluvii]|uniref:GNAT family N-acetyltransferase n=1 Tax=Chitinophaga defluvii TaxID=3163343 RepID=A0ABV2T015_9BACT
MEIVQATAMHLNEVAVLFDAYRTWYHQEPDFHGALAYIDDRLRLQDSVIYIAMEGEEIVGFTQLYPIFSSVRMKKSWLLNDLYVLEAHRGKGAASALLDKAARLAEDTGAGWILLQTDITNTNAQALYEKKGYVRDTTCYYYYREV